MSQLVPYLNFGFDDSQLTENDLFYYTQDTVDRGKMVRTYDLIIVGEGCWVLF